MEGEEEGDDPGFRFLLSMLWWSADLPVDLDRGFESCM